MATKRSSEPDILRDANTSTPSMPGALEKVIELLQARSTKLAKRTVGDIKEKVTGYRKVPEGEIYSQCIENIHRAAISLRTGTAPGTGEISEASIASTRAEQGVPVEDMLQAYRLSLGQIKDCFLEVSRGVLSTEQIIEGIRVLWESTDAVEVELAHLYQKQKHWAEYRDEQLWSHLFTGLLSARLNDEELDKVSTHFGLNKDWFYVPMRVRASTVAQAKEIQRKIEIQHQGLKQRPVFSVVEGDLACLLRDLPDSSINSEEMTAGLGNSTTLDGIADEWEHATRALTTAVTFGLEGSHTLDSLGLRPLVVSEAEVGDTLVQRYCGPFIDQGEFGVQILESVSTWLMRRRNFNQSADELHVHPNTLRYRLRRFEEVTHADFDEPMSLVEVWWALERWRTLPADSANETAK